MLPIQRMLPGTIGLFGNNALGLLQNESFAAAPLFIGFSHAKDSPTSTKAQNTTSFSPTTPFATYPLPLG